VCAEETTCALSPRVEDPATAVALPVKVNVHETTPDEFTLGVLHAAVTPFGNPDVMLMDDPAAPLATVKPPFGVAVTVTCPEPSDCSDSELEEAAKVVPGAEVTASVTCLLAVSPAPAAVTVIAVEATPAVDEAVNLRVCVLVLFAEVGVCGFADHAAVTPLGSPLTLHVMLPVKPPPVVAARLTAVVAPCTTDAEAGALESVSVGGCVTVRL